MVWGFLSYRFCLSPKNPPAAHAGHTTPGAASGDIDSVDTYSERASARPGTSSAPTGTVTLVPSKSSPMGSYRPPRCPGEKRFGYGVERQSILRSGKSRVLRPCTADMSPGCLHPASHGPIWLYSACAHEKLPRPRSVEAEHDAGLSPPQTHFRDPGCTRLLQARSYARRDCRSRQALTGRIRKRDPSAPGRHRGMPWS